MGYTSSSASAQTLTADLQSVDTPRTKSRPSIRKSQPASVESRMPTGAISDERPLRPPAKIPGR